MADPEGGGGDVRPPPKIALSMVLKSLKNQGSFTHISGTIPPTETANHSLESVQQMQYNHNSFVFLSKRKL